MRSRDALRISRSATAVALAGLLAAACVDDRCTSDPGAALWATYADSLGSRIMRAEEFYGDLEVDMMKAADPPSATDRYPYAGLIVFVSPDRRAVDTGSLDRLVIEYRLSGPISLILEQDGVLPGEDFRAPVAETDGYRQIALRFDAATFQQPAWARSGTSLRERRLIGVKFQVASVPGASARLVVRMLRLEGSGICFRRRTW